MYILNLQPGLLGMMLLMLSLSGVNVVCTHYVCSAGLIYLEYTFPSYAYVLVVVVPMVVETLTTDDCDS